MKQIRDKIPKSGLENGADNIRRASNVPVRETLETSVLYRIISSFLTGD